MKRGKKPKSKKRQAVPLLTMQEEELLDYLLAHLKDIKLNSIRENINSPRLAMAITEKLPGTDQEEVRLLLGIKDSFGQRDVQKAVKKALFKVKRRGIPIPEHEDLEGPQLIIKRQNTLETEAYLTPIDGAGSRGVFIAVCRVPKGVDMGIAAVNRDTGVDNFIYGRYSRKQSREIKKAFFDRAGTAVEATLAHAATILETAYRKNEKDLGEQAQDYLGFRSWLLKNTSLLDRSAIYDLIPQGDTSADFLTDLRIEELLGHDLLASWIVSPEKMKPVLKEISTAEKSPIILTEGQFTDRIEDIKEKAIQEIYPESGRLSLKYDLEEMAYVFFRLGEKRPAGLCLAAACTMTEKDSPIRSNRFLKAYMEHSINYYINIMGKNTSPQIKEGNPFSPIIKP